MCSCSFDLIEIRVIEEPEGEDISDGGLVDKGGERERPCSGGSGFQQSVLSTLSMDLWGSKVLVLMFISPPNG